MEVPYAAPTELNLFFDFSSTMFRSYGAEGIVPNYLVGTNKIVIPKSPVGTTYG
jgi:hypothetical protein